MLDTRSLFASESRALRAWGMNALSIAAIVIAGVAFAVGVPAQRAEIRVWTARAGATVLSEVGPEFEQATGHRLVVTSGLPADFARRFDAGEPVDVVLSTTTWIDQWIRDGRLTAASRVDVARSGIGIEVRDGRPPPDISSVAAFQRTLLEATSLAWLKVGSGLHMDGVVARLGIADAIASKVVRPDTDIVSELVAQGDIDIGITVITQILTTPGVVLVGPLPEALQSYVAFAAAVGARSTSPERAAQVLALLASPGARAVMKTQGLEPLATPKAVESR